MAPDLTENAEKKKMKVASERVTEKKVLISQKNIKRIFLEFFGQYE